jgi:hypothetical protein
VRPCPQEVRSFEQEVNRFEQEIRRFKQEVRRSGDFFSKYGIQKDRALRLRCGRDARS